MPACMAEFGDPNRYILILNKKPFYLSAACPSSFILCYNNSLSDSNIPRVRDLVRPLESGLNSKILTESFWG